MHFVKAAMVMAISLGLTSAQGPLLGFVFNIDHCQGNRDNAIEAHACVDLAEMKSVHFVVPNAFCIGYTGPNCQGPERPVGGPKFGCLPLEHGPWGEFKSTRCFQGE